MASDPAAGDEESAWLETDDDTSQVNEGELRFLTGPAGKERLHILNHITISPTSLIDGWVKLHQCYHNLTPLPDIQITYQYKAMQELTIASYDGIGRAWVDGQSVQMNHVTQNATICVLARVQILKRHDGGGYTLNNGPYHLRFLDGFYPLRVTLEVNYPDDLLTIIGVTPEPQPGLTLQREPGRVAIDTHFEGMLYTELRFQSREY